MDLATLYEAGFVHRCLVHHSKLNVVRGKMASYNVERLSTLYEFTSYNVDVVRGTTVSDLMYVGLIYCAVVCVLKSMGRVIFFSRSETARNRSDSTESRSPQLGEKPMFKFQRRFCIFVDSYFVDHSYRRAMVIS